MSSDKKTTLANDAFERYDFGDEVVEAHDSWDTNDQADYTKIVYVRCPEDNDPDYLYNDDHDASSRKVSFHVSFNTDDTINEVYGLYFSNGSEVGLPAEKSHKMKNS